MTGNLRSLDEQHDDFLVEPTSLPMSVGILSGLMWIPFSGLIEHWVGFFHAFARTGGIWPCITRFQAIASWSSRP